MPWSKSNLPDQVKGLPEHAQEIWVAAANSALKQYGDEQKAIATAWSAVKKAGYAKGDDGKWHKVELTEEHIRAYQLAEIKQTGKHWGKVLRHVAFLGAEAPAVKGLKDLDQSNLGPNGRLENVEITAVGKWRGTPGTVIFAEPDLDEIAANFQVLKDIEPVHLLIGSGHNDQDARKSLEQEGLPSFGRVDDVRRIGTKLVASFTQVPQMVRDLILNGRFPERSIRFSHDYVFGESTGLASIFMETTPEKEGEDMAGDAKFTETDLAERLKIETEKAVTAATEPLNAKIKELTEADKAKAAQLAEQATATKQAKIDGLCERMKTEYVAPVLIDDVKAVLAEMPDEGEVELSEKGKKGSPLDKAIEFLGATVKASKDSKMFVPVGERGVGDDAKHPGEGDLAEDAKIVKEMASYSDRTRKPEKTDD